jgi:putative RecB family exonuclease
MFRFPLKLYSSHLNNFRQCPRKFRCTQDDDLRVPFQQTVECFVGSAIHAALRGFFDIRRLPMHERRPEQIGGLLRNSWSRIPKGHGEYGVWSAADRLRLFGSKEQERACGQLAISFLEAYLASTDLSVLPLALEDWFEGTIHGVTLAGRIDRIDRVGDRGIAVWDYKTGKRPFHKTAQEIIDEGNYQLPLYGIIAAMRFPAAEIIRVGEIYVRFNEVYKLTWTRENLEQITEDVLDFVARMKAEQEFAPQPNALCPWCDYREDCPGKDSFPGFPGVIEEVSW